MSLHPLWPLAALAALAVVALGVAVRRTRTAPASVRRPALRRLAMAVLVLLVAVRPVVGTSSQKAMASDVDVLFLVDRTTSMAAEDWNGGQPRLRGVAHDIRKVAERYPGARFALVTFTDRGYVEMPLSTDATAVASLADSIQPEIYLYSRGSSISAGVETAAGLLRDAQRRQPARRRHVIYLGDGEQTSAQPPGSFAVLKPLVSGGAVLGYGTEQGGRMKTGFGSESYVSGSNGPGVSRIDEGNLRRIAGELGVDYLHRTGPDEPGVRGTSGGFAAVLGDARVTGGTETYWVFALGLLALALWELWDQATAHRRLRRELA